MPISGQIAPQSQLVPVLIYENRSRRRFLVSVLVEPRADGGSGLSGRCLFDPKDERIRDKVQGHA
jgi:hypothetical protein